MEKRTKAIVRRTDGTSTDIDFSINGITCRVKVDQQVELTDAQLSCLGDAKIVSHKKVKNSDDEPAEFVEVVRPLFVVEFIGNVDENTEKRFAELDKANAELQAELDDLKSGKISLDPEVIKTGKEKKE
jgi:hypothetical protein